MDTDSFIAHVKTKYIYQIKFMLNYEVERPISKRKKTKKIIGLMKDELGRKIMTEFVGLRAKTCRYLTNDNEENKTAKGKKNCVIKRKL